MRPILYSEHETAFDTNGLGILDDTISCPVSWELNGQYECTLKYPVTGIHYKEIKDRSIILVQPDPETQPQPFRVYRIGPAVRGVATFYARHLAYDLMGIPASPFSAAGVTSALITMKDHAVIDCPFTFTTDKTTASTMTNKVPTPIWNLLAGVEGSLLDTYKGEYQFDFFEVRLLNRLGEDRGGSIRYGKNLTTLEQDRNIADCYTGVYPYWADSDGLTVELPEKFISGPGTYTHTRIKVVDFSSEWQETPTVEQLRERTEKYISDNDIGVPKVSWKIEFVQLEQTEEYKWLGKMEQVLPGDTVNVVFPEMGVDVSARVVAFEYDPILERYDSVTLGSVRDNIAKTIANQHKATMQAQQAVANLDKSLDQKGVFNRLTNNGKYQGIFIDGDTYYFNGEYIRGKYISAENIGLGGKFSVFNGDEVGGYLGYMAGSTDADSTFGIGVADSTETSRFVATNKGARMQSGSTMAYMTDGGPFVIVGDLLVQGNIRYTGELIKE